MDILKAIPIQDLPRMKQFYETHLPYTYYVCCLLDNCIAWFKKDESRGDLIFLAPNGDWRTSGTFVLIMQFGTYDLYVFTLEKSYATLGKALAQTKVIDWTRGMTIFAVHKEQVAPTLKVLGDKKLPTALVENHVWRISAEKALLFDTKCPEDIRFEKLSVTHAPLINEVWAHKHLGSEKYIETLIEMNGGYGVFLGKSGELLAWALRTQLGCLGNLHTLEQHRRKGYGALMTKFCSKKIAQEGCDPWATIVIGNERSEALFGSLGFEIVDACTYIELY